MQQHFRSARSVPTFTLRSASALLALGATALAQNVPFLPRLDYDLGDPHPVQSAIEDFDKDGNLDIVVTTEGFQGGGKVNVLFGDGAGDFGTNASFVHSACWGVGVGDFNGDTWPDLAITTYGWAQHGIRVYLNDHLRGFNAAGNVSTLATPPVACVTGDFDGNGTLDLAAASEGGGYAVDWFRGNGNGTFSSFNYVPYTSGLVGRRIVAADFDNDQDLDLALAHSTGIKILLNTANTYDWFHPPVVSFPFASGVESLQAVDFDGDGVQDLVTGGNGQVRVWHGHGDGTFAQVGATQTTAAGTADLRVADIDGNGLLDVMVAGLSGIGLFYGQGGGVLSAPQQFTSGVQPLTGVVGDWNNDGRIDLAVGCNNYANDAYLSVHLQQDIAPPVAYCTAKTNSQGCIPAISSSGQAHATGTLPFEVSATYVINQQSGILAFGYLRAATPFQGGTLCVGGALKRTPVQNSGGTIGMTDCSGVFAYDMNGRIRSGLEPGLIAGATVDAQYWYRDPASASTTGLSNALEFVIAP